jgi:uncharacterized protein (TIGR00369 family)
MLTVDDLNAITPGTLPGLIGFQVVAVERGRLDSRLVVRPELRAPNGYLHAATVIALADTSCGFGARTCLPAEAAGFTTIELKANFLGTARSGALACQARLTHGGRSTQVWDATVALEGSERAICLFRCTQLVLWPQTARYQDERPPGGPPSE